MKSTVWYVTKRFQSSVRPCTFISPFGCGAWIWSQLVYVWLQKSVHHAWFRSSSVLYFFFSQSRNACWHSGQ